MNKTRFSLLLDVPNHINRGVPKNIFGRVDPSYFGKAADVNEGLSIRFAFRFVF